MPFFELRSFGPFTLDLARSQLHRGKIEIRMQPQPFRLLVLLTSRPGELITREEIQKELWEPDTFVDFEQGLNYAIRRVREALNDSGSTPVYLKTEPKRGYRFIGLVHRTTAPSEAQPTAGPGAAVALLPAVSHAFSPSSVLSPVASLPLQPTQTGDLTRVHPARRRWWIALLLTMLLVGGVLASYLTMKHNRPISIAVLPIKNLTGKSENGALADNITDALEAQLRMLSGGRMRIVAGGPSGSQEGQHEDPEITGRALGVTFVLQGTIHSVQNGNGVTLQLQLIRSSDGVAAWSRWDESDSARMLSESDELAAEILTSRAVGGAPLRAVSTYISPSPIARAAFEQGKRAFRERSRESLNASVDDFKTAIQADPKYADAFAQLAMAYEQLGGYGWLAQREAKERAGSAVEEALLLNPRLPDAHVARAYKEWFYDWDWTAAAEDFKQALRTEPANVDALHWYALVLATQGHPKEAKENLELALQLEPRSKTLRTNRGWLDYLDRDFAGAATRMEGVLQEDRYFYAARLKLWAACTASGDLDNAVRQLGSISLDLLNPEERSALDETYRQHGYKAALRAWVAETTDLKGFSLFEAQMAVASGDHDAAVRVLLKGYADHDGWMVFVPMDPLVQSVLSDPRLAGLRSSLERGQGKRS